MAEFKLSRILYTWKGNWVAATAYKKDDIVRYGGSSWVCIRAHTASTFAADLAYVVPSTTTVSPAWVKMVEGNAWRGPWAPSTLYNPTDIVLYGGTLYICQTSHTSTSNFDIDVTNWASYIVNVDFKEDWVPSTRYKVGDVVRYGGNVYRCIVGHLSGTSSQGLEQEQDLLLPSNNKWRLIYEGVDYKGVWAPTTRYKVNDLIFYNGSILRCNTHHTSISTFVGANWSTEFLGNEFESDWTNTAYYGRGSVVRYGGYMFYSLTDNQNVAPINSIYQTGAGGNAWQLIQKGINFRGTWTTSAQNTFTYVVTITGPQGGDVGNKYVLNGTYRLIPNLAIGRTYIFNQDDLGNVYYPNANGTVINPHPLNFSTDNISGVRGGGTVYLDGVRYFLNGVEVDYETYNGLGFTTATTRRVQITITENTPTTLYYWCFNHVLMGNRADVIDLGAQEGKYKVGDVVRRGGNLYVAILDTVSDESTLDYLDTSNWELVAPGQQWRGDWDENIEYSLNDLVIFVGAAYKCTFQHTSNYANSPGDNGEGIFYWTLLIPAGPSVGLRKRGDLLTYDLTREYTGDTSTFGPTALEAGNPGQVLTVNDQDGLIYRTYGSVARFYYVSLEGIDDDIDPERGISPFKPWRTVRYALEKAEDGHSGFTTIYIEPGRYDEVGPMVIPPRTVVLGSELRSTTIRANPANTALTGDRIYQNGVLNRLASVIPQLLQEAIVDKSPGNTALQVKLNAPTTSAVANEVVDLISDILQYIAYHLNNTGTDVSVVGTNTADTDTNHTRAIALLNANKEFLVQETYAYLTSTYPAYNFDRTFYGNLVRRYIEAWKYDITYTGNYKTLRAARFYRNSVQGSQNDDMFYVRDATGIRSCTLTGLQGNLNPPNVYDLYQRPTGGAFVSLDPGWGPNDTNCWITTRSPYIQGVTNIGSYCVGQKIDGLIHNGGNKSIVSNDFTQVLSGGIGAWVKNNARAELVSVFTYYCQIGYFAENGGIIRATNGNCSYGKYGAISDGVDQTEVPRTGTVNNRNQEAQVAFAFSGDFTDIIQILEWNHAGEGYTTASATFVGSGSGAQVEFDDFRDDAVFNVFIADSGTAAAPNVGGGGWTLAQNNAQINPTPSLDQVGIKISNADTAVFGTEYIGLRILITSGKGTGQYGYITAYNTGTRYINVSRESTGQPGWDHLIPGTPIVDFFDTTTTYRIEPRVIFGEPGFTSSRHTLPTTLDWNNIAFGETYKSFTNVASEPGTGSVVVDDGLVAVTATFDIIKSGRTYQVTINNRGAGYAVGDELTIIGTTLGGATPDNDLVITVTATSEDSTNSIQNFDISGRGSGGNFVLIPSSGATALYSINGETWTSTAMPGVGSWSSVAAGNNLFVAIARSSTTAAWSRTGETWTSATLPANRQWNAVAYGNGRFIAVAGDQNSAATTTNGSTWTSLTMPTIGDSTVNEWVDIVYGEGKWVAISNSNNVACYSNNNGVTWFASFLDTVQDSSSRDWVSVAYGNNRFVAISAQGDVAWSLTGENWSSATLPTQDGSTRMRWKEVRYGQGVFFAVCDTGSAVIGGDPTDGTTTFVATSTDGILWTARNVGDAGQYQSIGFGNPYVTSADSSVGKATPMWILTTSGAAANFVTKVRTGKQAQGRVNVSAGRISAIRLWDPGSGYVEPPEITIVDPLNTSDASLRARIGDGVLTNPSWINRGSGYRTASTVVTISGDGYADIIPTGKFITVSNLITYPGPGAQILINGNDEVYAISQITELGNINGGLSARFRISPSLNARVYTEHGTSVLIRERYSQCRITGHDFLDIGTGTFEETNYPELYATGLYVPAPENEVYEEDGGRVFYTATDQSGNFRTGELFAVEQATGIVTISADFFDLAGLSELKIGGVRLGGSGVVIREFSTDPLFTEDSNNIVPTQAAIAAYLDNRLSAAGSELATTSFIAGTVRVGPSAIENTLGLKIRINTLANFQGSKSGVRGSILAAQMFHRSFKY